MVLKVISPSNRTVNEHFPLLGMIPLVNIIMNFIIVAQMKASYLNEARTKNMVSDDIQTIHKIGLGMCICMVINVISFFGIPTIILVITQFGSLVLYIMYWIKSYQHRKKFESQNNQSDLNIFS